MKTVAVAAGASAEFSRGVLIGDVEEQTRWGLGSLAARVLAMSVIPLAIVIHPSSQGELTLRAFNVDDFDGALQNIPYESTLESAIILARGAGAMKSRPVDVLSPTITLPGFVPSEGGIPLNPEIPRNALLASLTVAARPSLTLLGVLNRFESYIDSGVGGTWALVFDQTSEKLAFLPDSSDSVELLSDVGALVPVAKFILTADAVNETVPGYGWE
jgi:hypothetical protein